MGSLAPYDHWEARVSNREIDWGDLMRAANGGDAAAYNRLLVSLAAALRAASRRGLGRNGFAVEEAEDIVQETLLAIHLKRHTWDAATPLGPWVRAIARNKLIDAMRRRGRRTYVPIDDVVETLAVDTPEPTPLPGRLDAHLRSLPERQRDVVRAISLAGASIRDTAARLNMSEGAVRVALHRGLAGLAQKFGRPAP
ncbi:MAG: polymerase sigma-70 factor, subfamily [Alphaproteobacteria bacterium]|jgi:RNA polymerase sigma-70 factor (ECF subfamily)|nr:polymerase sigma-70 factor, subfamily [Alphaproteobacteria bacterium]